MSKKEARRPEPSCFFGGALSTAVEPEFIPDTAANSKHRATHGGLPQSLFHR